MSLCFPIHAIIPGVVSVGRGDVYPSITRLIQTVYMHSLVSAQLTVGSTGLLQLWLYHCTLCSWWSHTITLPIFFWGENTTLYWGFLQETDANNLIKMKSKLSDTARDKWQIRVSGATEVRGMNIAVWVAASWGSGHAHPAVICDHEWAPVYKLRQSVHASLIIHNRYSYAPHVVSGLICFRETPWISTRVNNNNAVLVV